MKKWLIPAFAVVALAQISVPLSMIVKRERILQKGELFRFQTQPIDPADPLQGRYVTLNYTQDYIPYPDDQELDLHYDQKIYALLETDADGFAYFSGYSMDRPDGGDYLKTTYRGRQRQWDRTTQISTDLGLRIDLPFDRYYMNEEKAPKAEALARRATATTNCWSEVRISNGHAVIEDVLIEGTSVHELTNTK